MIISTVIIYTVHSLALTKGYCLLISATLLPSLFNMAEPLPSLSEFRQQFDDQLKCSVCLDQYTNPKTLPCHHSFCFKCILSLYQ